MAPSPGKTTEEYRTKMHEYRQKMAEWARIFEEEYGAPPTEDDRVASNTWNALNDKAIYYRRMLKEHGSSNSPTLSPGGRRESSSKRESSRHRSGGKREGSRSRGSRTPQESSEKSKRHSKRPPPGGAAEGKAPKKRMAISAETGMDEPGSTSGTYPIVPKDPEAEQAIEEASRNCVLFSGLGAAEARSVVDAMFEVKAAAGQTLIHEGDKGDNFYIVQSGTYAVFLKAVPGKSVKNYAAGDAFGELALMYNCPRAATVKCTGSGTLWALDRSTFRAILCSSQASGNAELQAFLGSVELLASLTQEQLTRLADTVTVLKFNGGEYVVRQGEKAESLFFIRKGRVLCQRRGSDDVFPVGEGECMGESALNQDVPEADRVRKADVVSDGATELIQLHASEFHKLLGSSLQEVTAANFNKKILCAVKFDGLMLKDLLSSSDLSKLLDALVEEEFKDGQPLVEEGASGDSFYIITHGGATVSTRSKGELASLGPGDYFGEMALVRAEPRSASVTAQGALKCLVLNRITFTRLLGPLQERLAQEMERRDDVRDAIKFSDLELRQTLGIGSFGQVRLVLHKPTQVAYALKALYKGQVIAQNQVAHVMSEKEIMRKCNHPFLLRMAASYQDADTLYMLLELVQGGELFTLLRAQRFFQEPVCAFYAATVVSAFEYLHDRSLCYRDLKPENLLIDAQGYLKVVDFGFAKEVKAKTYTLCGTPEYLAPEIILNKGHNQAADWWAVGILTYEMIMGSAPFVHETDPMQIYQQVLRGVLPPSKGRDLSKEAQDLVSKLLVKEPTERLGCMKLGVAEIKRHAFFAKTNWQRLEKKLTQAPYVPTLEDPLDVSAYESEWEPVPNEHADLVTPATAHLFEGFS